VQKARTRVLGSLGRLCVHATSLGAPDLSPSLLHLENPDRRPSAPQPELREHPLFLDVRQSPDHGGSGTGGSPVHDDGAAPSGLQTNRDAWPGVLQCSFAGWAIRVVIPEGTLELVVEQGTRSPGLDPNLWGGNAERVMLQRGRTNPFPATWTRRASRTSTGIPGGWREQPGPVTPIDVWEKRDEPHRDGGGTRGGSPCRG
jgi:hypothetical protein